MEVDNFITRPIRGLLQQWRIVGEVTFSSVASNTSLTISGLSVFPSHRSHIFHLTYFPPTNLVFTTVIIHIFFPS